MNSEQQTLRSFVIALSGLAVLLVVALLLLFLVALLTYSGTAPRIMLVVAFCATALGVALAVRRIAKAVRFWRQSEEANQLFFASVSDAVFICDLEGKFLDVNAYGCKLMEYSRDELLHMSVSELLAAEEFVPIRLQELLQNGYVLSERKLRTKSGRLVLLEMSANMLRNGKVLVIGRDATERREREEALRKSEALTRSIIYSAVDGIVTIDETGTIALFNPAAERIFGYSAEEVTGKNVSVLMPDPYRAEHDGYIQTYLKTLDRRTIGIPRELKGRRKDGSIFPAELSVSEASIPEGRIFTGVVRDITRRKQSEEALRQANETLRAVIETTPLAIFTLDLEGKVQSWNRAAEQMFGWTEAEVLHRPVPVVPESQRTDLLSVLERIRRGENLTGIERRRIRKDGSLMDVNIWGAGLRDKSGAVTQVVAVLADVSQKRHLEDRLRQSEKMQAVGRLAGGMAHDFNNILTVITGYSQMVIDELEPGAPFRSEIEEVLKAAEHASALTNQLLIFSRGQKVNAQVVDLNEIVRQLDRMLGRLIGEDIQRTTVLSQGLGKIKADPAQLEQVIVNLAVNARDAMPNGGNLIIETSNAELGPEYLQRNIAVRPGRYVMLSVSDTGKGMDAEQQARLFEPFFTTKGKGKGTGLGLSTVYGIVKQCGGDIWVQSELGKGSTFKILLPQAASEQVELERPQASAFEAVKGSETVLVVEDEVGVRNLVRDILKANGYRVLDASDTDDALRICNDHSGVIDLLLTDVVMPKMSGKELATRVTVIRPELKVLYMSGYMENTIVQHGIREPGLAFLQKPFSPSGLARKVRDTLDGASL